MKFSLKTYLITLCVVGAMLGWMTKLLLEEPETFLQVLTTGATVGPFLLAVGTIVRLGLKQPRRRSLVAWGIALLATPLIVFGMMKLVLPSGNPIRLLSTQRLIVNRLPAQIDTPWVWNELADRINAGKLSRDQVTLAIETLVTHMKTTRPGGWNQPLPWQRGFLQSAQQANLISDDQWIALCDAFYGTQPKLSPISPQTAGQLGTSLHIEYGNPWSDTSGLGVGLLWDVTQVSLDGAPIKVKSNNRFGQSWSAVYQGALQAGEHEFEFDIECAYVGATSGLTTSGQPLPVAQWPRGIKRWTIKVKTPVTVKAAEEQ